MDCGAIVVQIEYRSFTALLFFGNGFSLRGDHPELACDSPL